MFRLVTLVNEITNSGYNLFFYSFIILEKYYAILWH